MAKQHGLGRGMESLIMPAGKKPAPPPAMQDREPAELEVSLDAIVPSRWQPRRDFDQNSLEELAAAIESYGLLHPLVVRRLGDGKYELISGERRLRAMRDILKRQKAPVRFMNAEDAAMRELALVENLLREDLNPIEEAVAYQELQKELGVTHEAIAKRIKISRSAVTNAMRLLELPEEVKQLVINGSLETGKARALLALDNPIAQIKLARRAVEEGLSTRQVEQLASQRERDKPQAAEPKKTTHVADLEDRLRRHFGSKVQVDDNKGKGRIVIEYYSVEDAQRILDRMGLPAE